MKTKCLTLMDGFLWKASLWYLYLFCPRTNHVEWTRCLLPWPNLVESDQYEVRNEDRDHHLQKFNSVCLNVVQVKARTTYPIHSVPEARKSAFDSDRQPVALMQFVCCRLIIGRVDREVSGSWLY
jgi:hypothetical protein